MGTKLKTRIKRLVGRAVSDWQMIQPDDRILVGVSGGLDSQLMLNRLYALQKKAPISFELLPIYIDAGFEDSFARELERHVRQMNGSLKIEYTAYGVQAHAAGNSENPCFICSRLRRKKLFEVARQNHCGKIALGHTRDDIIETLFINMFYAGKIATMKPCQSFFNGTLDIIRPLAYVDKKEVTACCQLLDLPEFINNCPSANSTKRTDVRKMLEQLYQHNKHIKGNIFRAMGNIAADYLLDTNHDRYSKST